MIFVIFNGALVADLELEKKQPVFLGDANLPEIKMVIACVSIRDWSMEKIEGVNHSRGWLPSLTWILKLLPLDRFGMVFFPVLFDANKSSLLKKHRESLLRADI